MNLLDEVRTRRLLPDPGTARSIREQAGVSQARLAQELGVHRMTIVRWESGQRSPRGEHRTAYSRVLNELRAAATL